MADAGSDIEHHAGRLHAGHARWPQQVEGAGATVDVDEVHADGSLPQAHLPGAGPRCLDRREMKLLRAAVAVDDDGLAGKGTGRGGRERDGARGSGDRPTIDRSEEHTTELQ